MNAKKAFHLVLSEFVALTGGDLSALEDNAEVSRPNENANLPDELVY